MSAFTPKATGQRASRNVGEVPKFERRLRATASFTLDALLDDRAAGQ
jgi:hypothetical protein